MKTAVDAGVEPSQVVCECGGDHRSIEARHCPVFNVLRDLNRSIQEFLDAQQVLEFGKDGPMAHCLRCAMLFEYGWMIRSLEHQKTMSERHPEWNLAEEISRLRRYAEQVSVGCAEEKKLWVLVLNLLRWNPSSAMKIRRCKTQRTASTGFTRNVGRSSKNSCSAVQNRLAICLIPRDTFHRSTMNSRNIRSHHRPSGE